MLWRAANSLTRPFQSCRISCHGRVQSIPAGGPTTLRSNFRNKTSNLRRSVLYIFGSWFVALSVLWQVWIGPVHGMKSWMIGTVESMNLRPFMASSYGQNDVSSKIHYICALDDQRWVKRLMQWQPNGRRRGGRPAHLWHTVLANFCRWKGLQHWTGIKKSPKLDGNVPWFPSFCEPIDEIVFISTRWH